MKDVKRYDRDYLVGMLPNLNDADLADVLALAVALTKARTGALQIEAGQPTGLLFEALTGHLNAIAQPWATVARTKSGKVLLEREVEVIKFFNQHFKGWDDTKVLKLAFMRMMLELLSNDLKEHSVPATFGIMVTNLHRLPEVFRSAFPNYLESGMGALVLKKLRSPSLV